MYRVGSISGGSAIPIHWEGAEKWFADPDTEPKNGLDPGSTEPVYAIQRNLDHKYPLTYRIK